MTQYVLLCRPPSDTSPITLWYISLLLNSFVITLSHVVSLTYMKQSTNNSTDDIVVTIVIIFFTSFLIYSLFYFISGYVPMGKITNKSYIEIKKI